MALDTQILHGRLPRRGLRKLIAILLLALAVLAVAAHHPRGGQRRERLLDLAQALAHCARRSAVLIDNHVICRGVAHGAGADGETARATHAALLLLTVELLDRL